MKRLLGGTRPFRAREGREKGERRARGGGEGGWARGRLGERRARRGREGVEGGVIKPRPIFRHPNEYQPSQTLARRAEKYHLFRFI